MEKDILKFHTIYWPGFLLAAGLPLPEHVVVHSHWTMNGSKMSKSVGNVVDPIETMKVFGVDSVKFFLMNDSFWVETVTIQMKELHIDTTLSW